MKRKKLCKMVDIPNRFCYNENSVTRSPVSHRDHTNENDLEVKQ